MDEKAVAAASAKPAEPKLAVDETLPAGVDTPIILDVGIAVGESLAGDPLKGHVAEDVRVKGRIQVPKGAVVTGRLRRFERYDVPFDFVLVGIEFSEVSLPAGRRLRFSGKMKTVRLDSSIGTLVRPTPANLFDRLPASILPQINDRDARRTQDSESR